MIKEGTPQGSDHIVKIFDCIEEAIWRVVVSKDWDRMLLREIAWRLRTTKTDIILISINDSRKELVVKKISTIEDLGYLEFKDHFALLVDKIIVSDKYKLADIFNNEIEKLKRKK